MSVLYVLENKIDSDTLCCVSSEDALYEMEFLYNERPSKPFRFTGIGSIGNPEWICVEFTNSGAELITFAGIFNHNFVLSAIGDELALKACDDICEGSGACDWDAPDREWDLTGRVITNFRNIYQTLGRTYPSWRLDLIDQNNTYGYGEIGDFVLAEYQTFSSGVHLRPGRADGPIFYAGNQRTDYGQDWPANLSNCEILELAFSNVGDPAVVDEFHTFLKAVKQGGGKFIIVPDNALKFCYYCVITQEADFAQRTAYNAECGELREWVLPLKTLTEGISLL